MLMERVHIVNVMDITWGHSARTALNLRRTDLIYPLKSPSVFFWLIEKLSLGIDIYYLMLWDSDILSVTFMSKGI